MSNATVTDSSAAQQAAIEAALLVLENGDHDRVLGMARGSLRCRKVDVVGCR